MLNEFKAHFFIQTANKQTKHSPPHKHLSVQGGKEQKKNEKEQYIRQTEYYINDTFYHLCKQLQLKTKTQNNQ